MAFSSDTGGYAPFSPAALFASFRAKAGSILRSVQMGRMISTLSSMSDSQLSHIGISRSDIPKYAETLMEKD